MIVHDVEQNSPEWFDLRRSIPTASGFRNIMTPSDLSVSKQADAYAYRIVAGRLGYDQEHFSSLYTQRGHELEPMARSYFELIMEKEVEQVGFVTTDDGRVGCSPDGLIKNQKVGLEIKCPAPHTHIKYLANGTLPIEYKLQVYGSMLVTGYEAWYFMSFCPGIDTLILKVERDEEIIKVMRHRIDEFNKKVDEIESRVRK